MLIFRQVRFTVDNYHKLSCRVLTKVGIQCTVKRLKIFLSFKVLSIAQLSAARIVGNGIYSTRRSYLSGKGYSTVKLHYITL